MTKSKKYILYLFIITSIIFLGFYIKDKNNSEILPVDLTKNHICACDSMIIIDYKGPKAQILWNDNSRTYYCEVREAFYESTKKIKNKNIKAFFVQDFSGINWDSYIDKWILAENSYYVIDSKKNGAMGLTYVPFSNIEYAKSFIEKYDGKILKYNEITIETLNKSSLLLKDRIMY